MQVDDFHGLWVLQPFDVTDKLPMYIVLYGLREFFCPHRNLLGSACPKQIRSSIK